MTAQDFMDRLFRDNGERTPDGRCYDFEDGMDGFAVHADGCQNAGHSWTSGSGCIKLSTWRGYFPEWLDKRHR